MIFALIDTGVERKINHTRLSDFIQHRPRNICVGEVCLQIDVGNTAAGTLLVQNGAKAKLLLNGTFLRQRNPLVGVDKLFIQVIDHIVFLTQDDCCTLGGNTLNVKGILIGKSVLDLIENLEDFACERYALVCVAYIAELISLGIAKLLNDFVKTKDAHSAILLIHLNGTILIVGKQTLFDIASNDVTHRIKCLTAQGSTLLQQRQILLLVTLSLQCNTHQIDSVDLNRADGQRCAANRVDKCVQLGSVRQQTAAVGKGVDIAADKEIAVIPCGVVVTAPTGERFINELAVTIQQTVS